KGLYKYESLYRENVKNLLGAALGIAPDAIRMTNDASAFLMGERFCGAGAGHRNIVGITLGTGVGSAAYYNDCLEEGDLYRTDFERGKAEDYLSARWLLKMYEQKTGVTVNGVREMAERVPEDPAACQLFDLYGRNLGRVLAQRYARQGPEVVIVGGNIAKAWSAFIPAATEELEKAGQSFNLKPSLLGEDAALIGAAFLEE
ncbi:MAG TPA: ROK family protein, partial [Chitinophagaceae bacterium]|nr:ROK family protein [Chitinophagaceae bacterium]